MWSLTHWSEQRWPTHCDSDSCNRVAIARCDRCGNMVCGSCSHPVTPRIANHWVCQEWCLGTRR